MGFEHVYRCVCLNTCSFQRGSQMKQCNNCKETKPFTEFHKHKTCKGGYMTYCKPCFNYQTLAGKHRKRYGLSPEQMTNMKKSGCELCHATENLHIDHNHDTNEIRGVLCTNCNRGLGHFKDSPELLKKAAEYLEKKGNYSKWQN